MTRAPVGSSTGGNASVYTHVLCQKKEGGRPHMFSVIGHEAISRRLHKCAICTRPANRKLQEIQQKMLLI